MAAAGAIEHFIFLVHPCCYEPTPDNADSLADNAGNLTLYVDREAAARRRWEQELAATCPTTFVVVLTGPQYHSLNGAPPAAAAPAGHQALRRLAAARLGEARVFYPEMSFDPAVQARALGLHRSVLSLSRFRNYRSSGPDAGGGGGGAVVVGLSRRAGRRAGDATGGPRPRLRPAKRHRGTLGCALAPTYHACR
jgi:hypothetical protein